MYAAVCRRFCAAAPIDSTTAEPSELESGDSFLRRPTSESRDIRVRRLSFPCNGSRKCISGALRNVRIPTRCVGVGNVSSGVYVSFPSARYTYSRLYVLPERFLYLFCLCQSISLGRESFPLPLPRLKVCFGCVRALWGAWHCRSPRGTMPG